MDETSGIANELSPERPFPGLAPFEERHAAYFFGRRATVQQIMEWVDRQTLLVVFSASGMGKTSLLRAGVFPQLRAADRFPIPIRLRPERGSLVKSIIEDVYVAAAAADVDIHSIEIRSGGDAVAVTEVQQAARATLWGFFRYNAFFSKKDNQILEPVLVLDQFEELFTKGDGDAQQANEFFSELSSLLEQFLPPKLQPLVRDGALDPPKRTRLQVRCIIAIREDFLAELESARECLPLLSLPRFRLGLLSSEEAIAAICQPSADLVTLEVARQIVEHLSRAEGALLREHAPRRTTGIEPSLLSLFCRALNERRLSLRLPTIDARLLEQSRGQILRDFYHWATSGLGRGTVKFIEEKLVSKSGYRASAPRSDAIAAGATEAALAHAVDCRLLRVEERYGEPQYELIHDVIVPEVRAARSARRQRWLVLEVVAAVVALALLVTSFTYRQLKQRAEREATRLVADQLREAAAGLHNRLSKDYPISYVIDCRRLAARFRLQGSTQELPTDVEESVKSCKEDAEKVAQRLEQEASALMSASPTTSSVDHARATIRLVEAALVRDAPRYEGMLPDARLALTLRSSSDVGVLAFDHSERLLSFNKHGVSLRAEKGDAGWQAADARTPIHSLHHDSSSAPPPSSSDSLAFEPRVIARRLVTRKTAGGEIFLGHYDRETPDHNLTSIVAVWKPDQSAPVIYAPEYRLSDVDLCADGKHAVAALDFGLEVISLDGPPTRERVLPSDRSWAFLHVATNDAGGAAAGGVFGKPGDPPSLWNAGVATIGPDLQSLLGPIATPESVSTVTSLVSVGNDDRLLIGTSNGTVMDVSGRGAKKWKASLGGSVRALGVCRGPEKERSLTLAADGGNAADRSNEQTLLQVPFAPRDRVSDTFSLFPGAPNGRPLSNVRSAVMQPGCEAIAIVSTDHTIRVITAPKDFSRSPAELIDDLRRRLGFTEIHDGATKFIEH